MEYQNYLIVFKQVDFNLFIKFTNKNSNISYENIITTEQIDNLPINKFVKILENSINLIPNYNIEIESSPDENYLFVCLTHDNEIINISNKIQLNQVKSNDVLIKRIEQLERIVEGNNKILNNQSKSIDVLIKKIEQLEKIIVENNKIFVESFHMNLFSPTKK